LANPGAGDPVRGCGLLRKLRFTDRSRGKGKRGGLRIIYMLTPEVSRVDLITVYGKDEKDDLTKDELAAWCRLARVLRAHLMSQHHQEAQSMAEPIDHESLSVFEQVKQGLEQSIAHSRGQLTLRTTRRPPPPPPLSARRVTKLRKKLGMSQAVFAAMLNVSPKLVQGWEQGLRKPDRAALRLLQIVGQHPKLMGEMFGRTTAPSRTPRRAA
jgi:DNA-binding transcriptional regulator YiaG